MTKQISPICSCGTDSWLARGSRLGQRRGPGGRAGGRWGAEGGGAAGTGRSELAHPGGEQAAGARHRRGGAAQAGGRPLDYELGCDWHQIPVQTEGDKEREGETERERDGEIEREIERERQREGMRRRIGEDREVVTGVRKAQAEG